MPRPSRPHNLITQIIFLRRTSHENFRATFFCSLLTISPCWVQISPSTPSTAVPAGYVLPLMWHTEFHNNEKRQNHIVAEQGPKRNVMWGFCTRTPTAAMQRIASCRFVVVN